MLNREDSILRLDSINSMIANDISGLPVNMEMYTNRENAHGSYLTTKKVSKLSNYYIDFNKQEK